MEFVGDTQDALHGSVGQKPAPPKPASLELRGTHYCPEVSLGGDGSETVRREAGAYKQGGFLGSKERDSAEIQEFGPSSQNLRCSHLG